MESTENNVGALKPAALSLWLLGSFSLEIHGEAAPPMTRPARLLLGLLALHGREPMVEREFLAATLWPDSDDSAARYNLRRALTELRTTLGSEAGRIAAPTPRTLHLDLSGDAFCDVAAVDAAIEHGYHGRHDDTLPSALDRLASRGSLLAGEKAEWIIPEREARIQACLDAREALAARYRERGLAAEAIRQLRMVLNQDPTRETAVRNLMRVLHDSGQSAAAFAVYHTLSNRLRRDGGGVGGVPDAETTALRQQLYRESDRLMETSKASTPILEDASFLSFHQLPRPLATLIGRDQDRLEIAAFLHGSKNQPSTRLLTLTGAGGVGKTQLALIVAESVRAEFADGVCFVDLAPIADSDQLPTAVANALRLPDDSRRGSGSLLDKIGEILRSRELLLLLDNCEHLNGDVARLAVSLLRQCPRLTILATSREALHVPGEVSWRLPGLSENAAARLFVERAAQANPAVQRSATTDPAVRQIAAWLDGIPLAIEMAAARTRALSIIQIAERLDNAFRLLTVPGGDLLPRHQTLRATLDWSYDLLSPAEKILLSRLSVFAGGWTLAAAEAVGAGGDVSEEDVFSLLASLTDKSLVQFSNGEADEGRYRLLETVRQYAAERLRLSGGEADSRRRHRDYFLRLAEMAAPNLLGPEQTIWLFRLEAEHDNLRCALTRNLSDASGTADPLSLPTIDDTRADLRLAAALWRFWYIRGYQTEGRQHLERVLNRWRVVAEKAAGNPDAADVLASEITAKAVADALTAAANLAIGQDDYPSAQARFDESLTLSRRSGYVEGVARNLANLGVALSNQNDYEPARALLTESLALFRQLDDKKGIDNATSNLANVAYRLGEYNAARDLMEESLRICREIGSPAGTATTLMNLANLHRILGENDHARALQEESLLYMRSIGDKRGIADSLNNLGLIAKELHDLDLAQAQFEESLGLYREIGDRIGVANVHSNLGNVACDRDDIAAARTHYETSLRLKRQIGDRLGIAITVHGYGGLLVALGDLNRGVTLLAAAVALRKSIGVPLPPIEQASYDKTMADTRVTLGDDLFEKTAQSGRNLTWQEAVTYALQESALPTALHPGQQHRNRDHGAERCEEDRA